MRKAAIFAALIAGTATLAPVASHACSLESSFQVPTNFGMVESADLIILGRTESTVSSDYEFGDIGIVPVKLLKGDALPDKLVLSGRLSDPEYPISPSDPYELERAHPDAYGGMCSRITFIPNSLMLLFVANRGGQYQVTSYPFARNAEDVPGEDGLWVQTVELYIRIAALPQSERIVALTKVRDELRKSNDAGAKSIADDIDRHLERLAKK